MSGLDLIVIEAAKTLLAPAVALTGSIWVSVVMVFSPIAIGVSSYLDIKRKKRGAK